MTNEQIPFAKEFFHKIDAGVPQPPEPIVTTQETHDWIIGISKAPLKDTEPLELSEEVTPEGKPLRYSRWPGHD